MHDYSKNKNVYYNYYILHYKILLRVLINHISTKIVHKYK